jgi:hypothetical protein
MPRTQRCFFLFFAVEPPKIPADRKDGKELNCTYSENNLRSTYVTNIVALAMRFT